MVKFVLISIDCDHHSNTRSRHHIEKFSRYGIDRFRGDSAESTWIYQISYHAVIDYHLSQTIKKSMGRTVMDWIDEYTLSRIRHLLSTTEDSQESIAEDTNLENTTSLIRFFKKKTGEPPHEYRNMKK